MKFRKTLCGGVFPERPRRNRTRPSPGKKTGIFAMMFNGSLIENLIAAVERAEQRAQLVEPIFAEDLADEPWFASGHESTDNESKLLGVA
jgi:hypothetical protein